MELNEKFLSLEPVGKKVILREYNKSKKLTQRQLNLKYRN